MWCYLCVFFMHSITKKQATNEFSVKKAHPELETATALADTPLGRKLVDE